VSREAQPDELGRVRNPDGGWIDHEWAERVAICMESGSSYAEAKRVADADRRRKYKAAAAR
jgi:hypothetical protein